MDKSTRAPRIRYISLGPRYSSWHWPLALAVAGNKGNLRRKEGEEEKGEEEEGEGRKTQEISSLDCHSQGSSGLKWQASTALAASAGPTGRLPLPGANLR